MVCSSSRNCPSRLFRALYVDIKISFPSHFSFKISVESKSTTVLSVLLLTQMLSEVVPSSFFTRQCPWSRFGRQHWPALIPYPSRRSSNCHQTPRCCRSERKDCQCATNEHKISRCWWFKQHHAEYVASDSKRPRL